VNTSTAITYPFPSPGKSLAWLGVGWRALTERPLSIPWDLVERQFRQAFTPSEQVPKLELRGEHGLLDVDGEFVAVGSHVAFSLKVEVERLRITQDQATVALRVHGATTRAVDGKAVPPLSTVLVSGALDLNRIGGILLALPEMPPGVVYAHDDLIVIDLMHFPQVREQIRNYRNLIGAALSVVSPAKVRFERDAMVIPLERFPLGWGQFIARLRSAWRVWRGELVALQSLRLPKL
jgi:hypothetical protein